MATSSSGGSSLRQLQRRLTLFRQYLALKNIQIKNSINEAESIGNTLGGVPSHPLVKSSDAVEPHTAAALQALNQHFQQLRARGQSVVSGDHAQSFEPNQHMSSSNNHQSVGGAPTLPHAATGISESGNHQETRPSGVLEFLEDGNAGSKGHSSSDGRISRFASTSSLHPYEDIGSEHSTYVRLHYPASAPMSRTSSPMARPPHVPHAGTTGPVTPSSVLSDSANSILQPSTPNHNSIHKPYMAVPAPTYTTISIPIARTSKTSNRLASSNTSSTSNNTVNTTNTTTSTTSKTTTTGNGAVSIETVAEESDLQKAIKAVNSYIPDSLSLSSLSRMNLDFFRNNGNKPKTVKKEPPRPQWMDRKRDVISKTSVDSRTRHLVRGVTGDSEGVLLRRLSDLSHHLRTFPFTKGAAVKCGAVGRVLRVLSSSKDGHVAQEARAALTLLGYTGPVRGRGLKILTIDGGGVRGLVAIELLRRLEQQTGRPIHETFDFICGVSTGAIVAVLVGVHRLPLDECEELYRDLSNKVFKQTTFKGAKSLVLNSSYYDSQAWDAILQENMGDMPLLASAADDKAPKLCLVASHGVRLTCTAYLFRNYVLPYRVASHYTGTSDAKMWEAVRASAAAPGYFTEFQLHDKVLMDGGILMNNPAAIAVHEARQLWPDEDFQCVVSVGTGRCHPMEQTLGVDGTKAPSSINWTDKLRSVINSATDTEGVHTVLHDLLPSNVYFRFNPHLTDEFALDETRPDRVAAMMEDTRLYARKNATKFEQVAGALNKEKTPYHKARDFVMKGRLLHGFDVEG